MGLVFFNPFRYSMSFTWGISIFTFKVFVDRYVLTAILLIVFWLFCSFCVTSCFLLFLCNLVILFSA